jgi:hypothetical protein
MKILGSEYTKRETVFLFLLLLLTIAFLLSAYAHEADIKGLRKTTQEAIQKFNQCQNGYMITSYNNGTFVSNMTIKDFSP